MILHGITASGALDDGRVVIIECETDMTFVDSSATAGANEKFMLPFGDLFVPSDAGAVAFRYVWDASGPYGRWELLWLGTVPTGLWIGATEDLQVATTLTVENTTQLVTLWEPG